MGKGGQGGWGAVPRDSRGLGEEPVLEWCGRWEGVRKLRALAAGGVVAEDAEWLQSQDDRGQRYIY